MSYEHWYKKVRFLQRANIFSAIATASFDAYCTILYIDYLKYANHAKENHSKFLYWNKLDIVLNVFKLSFLSPFVRESLTNHIHAEVHKVFMYQAIESVVIGYCVVMQLVTYTTFQLFVGMFKL